MNARHTLRLYSLICCLCIVFAANQSFAQDTGVSSKIAMHKSLVSPVAAKSISESRVKTVAHQSDGSTLWAITQDGFVHALNPLTLEPKISAFQITKSMVCRAAFLPGETGLLVSSYDGKVLPVGVSEWMPEKWQIGDAIRPIEGTSFESMAISPTGSGVAVGARDGTVALISLETGKVTWKAQVSDLPINCIAWSHGGDKLAVGTGDYRDNSLAGKVHFLDLNTGESTQELAHHRSKVNAIVFDAGGQTMTSCGTDQQVLTYLLSDLDAAPRRIARQGSIESAMYLQNGQFAVALYGGQVAICDLLQDRMYKPFTGHPPSKDRETATPVIQSMSQSPDGKHLVTAELKGTICVWDLEQATSAREGFLSSTHWNVDRTKDFLKVGRFVQQDPLGRPLGWDDLSAFENNQATFRPGRVSLRSANTRETVSIATSVELPQDAKFVTFEVMLSGPSVERSEDPADYETAAAGAGVVFTMFNSNGESRELPRIDISYKGYRGRATKFKTVRVLPTETKLKVRIELVNARGVIDVNKICAFASSTESEPSERQMQLLQAAIVSDDDQAIAKLIQADPRLLEIRSEHSDNGSPLTRAAWRGSAKVAAKLIELGADVESQDYVWGNTPLQWCCFWGQTTVAEVLLESGAQIKDALRRAQSSRDSGRSPSGTSDEYDVIVKLVAQHEKSRADAGQ